MKYPDHRNHQLSLTAKAALQPKALNEKLIMGFTFHMVEQCEARVGADQSVSEAGSAKLIKHTESKGTASGYSTCKV